MNEPCLGESCWPRPKYPEHKKLMRIKDKSQAVGQFIDEFLPKKGCLIVEYHKHTDGCYASDTHPLKDNFRICGLTEQFPIPTQFNLQKLLAEYFDIDQEKLDREKDQMLEEIRAANK